MNEKLENIINTNLEVEAINLTLNKECSISLVLYFQTSVKKRYLINEILIIDNIKIEEQINLLLLKAFLKKFVKNKLDHSYNDKIPYLKYVTKEVKVNNSKFTTRSLQYKNNSKTIYFSDIEIEALLERWKEALWGYSKVQIIDKNSIFSINPLFSKINIGNGSQMNLLESKDEFSDIVNSIVDNGFNQEEIQYLLKK